MKSQAQAAVLIVIVSVLCAVNCEPMNNDEPSDEIVSLCQTTRTQLYDGVAVNGNLKDAADDFVSIRNYVAFG